MTVLDMIYNAGFSAYLHGFGAVDSWLSQKDNSGTVQILTDADTANLAKLFENLRYPGADLADAALDENDQTWYFRCECGDFTAHKNKFLKLSGHPAGRREAYGNDNHISFNMLEFYQDCKSRVFHDPRGIYPLLKDVRRNNIKSGGVKINPGRIICEGLIPGSSGVNYLMDAALILAKYFPVDSGAEHYVREIAEILAKTGESRSPAQEEQRVLLCSLVTSSNPALGMELLKTAGFIGKFWPELAILEQAGHSKEFHPEGNAWNHTMETFRYRKSCICDLELSLGLLLHDTGKPIANSTGSRRYDGHAELGETQARRFLERLGFSSSITHNVCFLVRNHMLPAAIPRLPVFRTSEIMASPLFPLLMELYRCDESSSFKGLDGYYESSAAYQSFLKNRRNPYHAQHYTLKQKK
ncbi:MAG: HD domain-containing protein [Treponema sp.]|nr:HD domain-containing protein [Treponema sp.]